VPHAAVFHAGTDIKDGRVVAHGGRVLTVCGTGPDLRAARAAAYRAVEAVVWEDKMFRTDIGLRALARAQTP
jgi:phosphoribosylamine--glycine ligase